jgi:hypothetical protein
LTDGTKRPAPPRSSFAANGLRNYSFKLPPRLVVQLDKIAVSEGRSRNAHVRLMLTESVDIHLAGQKKLAAQKNLAEQKKQRKAEAGARA